MYIYGCWACSVLQSYNVNDWNAPLSSSRHSSLPRNVYHSQCIHYDYCIQKDKSQLCSLYSDHYLLCNIPRYILLRMVYKKNEKSLDSYLVWHRSISHKSSSNNTFKYTFDVRETTKRNFIMGDEQLLRMN